MGAPPPPGGVPDIGQAGPGPADGAPGEPEQDLVASLTTTAVRLQRAAWAYQNLFVCTFGLVACFHGRHFTYSVLFWKVFGEAGWPAIRSNLRELWQRSNSAYRAVRQELPAGIPTLQEAGSAAQQAMGRLQAIHEAYDAARRDGDADAVRRIGAEMQALQEQLGQAGSAATAASTELEPSRLLRLVRGMYNSLAATMDMAMSEAAAKAGFSYNVGDTVMDRTNHAVASKLHELVDLLMARAGPELRDLGEDPNARRWINQALHGMCNSVGIVLAYYTEALVFTLSNARVGAELVTCEVAAMLGHRRPPGQAGEQPPPAWLLAQGLLCGCGLYYQFFHGCGGLLGTLRFLLLGGHSMPVFLRLVLFAPLAVERGLQAVLATKRMRASG